MRIIRWKRVRPDHPAQNGDDDDGVRENADGIDSDRTVEMSERTPPSQRRKTGDCNAICQTDGCIVAEKWNAMFETILSSVAQHIIPSVVVTIPFVEGNFRNRNIGGTFNRDRQSRMRAIKETPASMGRVVHVVDVDGVPSQAIVNRLHYFR